MNLLSRLFGHGKKGVPEPRDIRQLMSAVSAPAAHAIKAESETHSFFGSVPLFSTNFIWPSKNGKPLAFLGQINLAEVAAVFQTVWLPAVGTLLFFYDMVEHPGGFDPKDAGGWRVVYCAPQSLGLWETERPEGLPKKHILKKMHLQFQRLESFPSMEREATLALNLTEKEADLLGDFLEGQHGPRHQIGGFPFPIQDDQMEQECQLASNGVYCHNDPRAEQLREGAKEWRLLLQMDSDDEVDVMWGDGGMLYFWVREEDAKNKRFDRTWVTWQCY
jgi:uncharacterized protein YwqG